jgi:rhodanese-related sulfurtransferase
MSLNKLLASIAFILALLAAFIGSPSQQDMELNTIAAMIENEQDHITPLDLAERLIAGERIRLIDLRDSSSYHTAHVAGAERMDLSHLLNGGVMRNERIVLYSEGGTHASQGWTLLKMKRFDSVVTLLGGFHAWKETVLSPKLQKGDPELPRRSMISRYFGGEPVVSNKGEEKRTLRTPPPDKQTTPVVPKVIFPPDGDRLREGC